MHITGDSRAGEVLPGRSHRRACLRLWDPLGARRDSLSGGGFEQGRGTCGSGWAEWPVRGTLTPVGRTPSYRTVRQLARGGMGVVELAVRVGGPLERLYALKRLPEEKQDDLSMRRMFLDEARIAGLIRHSNVVSVHEVGEDERGPFLVMDLVDGINLGELLAFARSEGSLVPVQLCLRIAAQCAQGLGAAHDLVARDGTPLQVVHRDVSPTNVLLGFDGVARLTDFGIAKARGRHVRTTTGVLKGKVGYMSPEQLRFEEPDHRSDLWSLGVVLYELLAADRLFAGDDVAQTARLVLNEPVPDLLDRRPDIGPELMEILYELLAKDPALRPRSAREVAERLEEMALEAASVEGPLHLDSYLKEHFAERRASIVEMHSDAFTHAQTLATGEPGPNKQVGDGPRRRNGVLLLVLGVGLGTLVALGVSRLTGSEASPVPEVHAGEPLTTPSAGPTPLADRGDGEASEPGVETPALPAEVAGAADPAAESAGVEATMRLGAGAKGVPSRRERAQADARRRARVRRENAGRATASPSQEPPPASAGRPARNQAARETRDRGFRAAENIQTEW